MLLGLINQVVQRSDRDPRGDEKTTADWKPPLVEDLEARLIRANVNSRRDETSDQPPCVCERVRIISDHKKFDNNSATVRTACKLHFQSFGLFLFLLAFRVFSLCVYSQDNMGDDKEYS